MTHSFKYLLSGALALAALGAQAQSVIFPQEAQPGKAVLTADGGNYSLSNDLLEAKFVTEGGKLRFGGCEAMDLAAGTELFYITLGDGSKVAASEMTCTGVQTVSLTGDAEAVKGSDRFDGQAIDATFTYGALTVDWRAVLRDGSHYLRTEMAITASRDQAMKAVIPMTYTLAAGAPKAAPVGNTRGQVILSDKIFAGLETPTAYNTVGTTAGGVLTPESGETQAYTIKDHRSSYYVTDVEGTGLAGIGTASDRSNWHFIKRSDGTWNIKNATTGAYIDNTASHNTQLTTSTSEPSTGWSLNKVNDDNEVTITAGSVQFNMTLSSHNYQVFNWGSGTNTTDEGCLFTVAMVDEGETFSEPTPMQGLWSRVTTLAAGKTWNVSAVVGLVAPGQARRSFLAYSERERALPWRPMVHYNSWYELNIDRNNSATYDGHMTEAQCLDVIDQWRTNLYEKHGENITAFVWDDGWDEYGTWTFNKNFPNGFSKINEAAVAMNTGIGTWLGPVGGYGTSGSLRRQYWANNGGMQLSNPKYYEVFLGAVTKMSQDYDFRFFKLDGISAQFSATGPDAGDTGNENAEGIIEIEQRVREINPNIFFNTTVGTWASPFWYHYTDATWRQENDYGTIGNNTIDRENWITYRDRLVYQNYVQNSPLCPINTLMTHGVILSTHGAVSTNMTYKAVQREMRCAFACGSAMIELYCDYERLNNINKGALWGDIAQLIKWQRDNADVLPDIHWVGGNPWNGTSTEVYGWASWNGEKATLALRNGSTKPQTFTLNLRKALEIPDYITDGIVLHKAFDDIADIDGLPMGEKLDLDKDYEISIPRNTVLMWGGVHANRDSSIADVEVATPAAKGAYDLMGRPVANPTHGLYIIDGQKVFVK